MPSGEGSTIYWFMDSKAIYTLLFRPASLICRLLYHNWPVFQFVLSSRLACQLISQWQRTSIYPYLRPCFLKLFSMERFPFTIMLGPLMSGGFTDHSHPAVASSLQILSRMNRTHTFLSSINWSAGTPPEASWYGLGEKCWRSRVRDYESESPAHLV